MPQEKIVAVGLLTQRDLDMLGSGFHRAYPVSDVAGFEDLLAQLDEVAAIEPQEKGGPVS